MVIVLKRCAQSILIEIDCGLKQCELRQANAWFGWGLLGLKPETLAAVKVATLRSAAPISNRPWCSQLGADAATVPTQVVLLLYLEQPYWNECACVSQAGLLDSAGLITKKVTTMTNYLSTYDSSCTLLHGGHTCTAQLLYVMLDMGESIEHMSVECSLCTPIHQGAVQGCSTRRGTQSTLSPLLGLDRLLLKLLSDICQALYNQDTHDSCRIDAAAGLQQDEQGVNISDYTRAHMCLFAHDNRSRVLLLWWHHNTCGLREIAPHASH